MDTQLNSVRQVHLARIVFFLFAFYIFFVTDRRVFIKIDSIG